MKRRVRVWADPRFDGIEFERVALAGQDARVRLDDRYAVTLVDSGSGTIHSNGTEFDAHEGTCHLCCPNQVWSFRAGSNQSSYRSLHLNRRGLQICLDALEGGTDRSLPRRGTYPLTPKSSASARRLFAAFEARASVLERAVALVEFVEALTAEAWPADTEDDEPTVAPIRRFLNDHATETVPISRLATRFSLTPFHLIRRFRRAVGVPPHQYATLLRIRHAERLLRRGVAIVDAASRAGFCDQSHLSRCFRRIRGVTPGEFRSATLVRDASLITGERALAYRLQSGERLWRVWLALRAARAGVHGNP
jgi:AraC-like DNA-binding protein